MTHLLTRLKHDPSPADIHRAKNALLDILQYALKRWRDRKLPWWSYAYLTSTIETAFHDALTHLPETLEFDAVSQYIEDAIDLAVEKLIARQPGECAATSSDARRGYLDSHDARRRYRGKNDRQYIEHVAPDQNELDELFAIAIKREQQFWFVVEQASRQLSRALRMLWDGHTLTEICRATGYTGVRMLREYRATLDTLHKRLAG